MKQMKDYIPEAANLDKDKKYETLWNTVYNKRLKKQIKEDKAVHSANAVVYAEILKDFINKG